MNFKIIRLIALFLALLLLPLAASAQGDNEKRWKDSQAVFFASNPEYSTERIKNVAFVDAVNRLLAKEESKAMTDAEVFEAAKKECDAVFYPVGRPKAEGNKVAAVNLAIPPVPGQALTPGQVFDKVKDSVVVVKSLDAGGSLKMQGSGVLLPSGKIATNCHVVKGGAFYQVGRGKQLIAATLYAEDGDKDICILDAKGLDGKPAQPGKAAGLKVGDPVYAVGAPQGLELSLSNGIVAQLRGGPPPFIQTTVAISPGSSGGGLFDGEGQLVGLTSLYIEGGQSLNFAMPVEWIGEIKPGIKPTTEGIRQTEWLKHVVALEEMKDWQGMLDWSRKWTKSEPENSVAWVCLGIAYKYLKRYNDAIEAYRQAIRIDSKYAAPWSSLGVTYHNLKRYDDAIEAYSQAISINPKDAAPWNSLGSAYNNLSRYNEATEAYRQAVSINPKHAGAWYGLGIAYDNLNRYDDAIEAFRKAISINSKFADAWSGLGFAYRNLNRYDDAIEAFRKTISINPKDVDAWSGIGLAYGSLKRYNDAIEAYRQAIRIDSKNAKGWFGLGMTYDVLNRHDDSIAAYRQAIRTDPKDAKSYMLRGRAYAMLGNQKQAIKDYDKAIDLDPNYAHAYSLRADLYTELGNRNRANEDLKIAAGLGHEGAQDTLRSAGISWIAADIPIAKKPDKQVEQPVKQAAPPQVKPESSEDINKKAAKQSAEIAWQKAQREFYAENPDYEKNKALNNAYVSIVNGLISKPEAAKMTDRQILLEGKRIVDDSLGLLRQPPEVEADQRYSGIKGIVLMNGNIIEGQILSLDPDTVKIRTKEGKVLSYDFKKEVERLITK